MAIDILGQLDMALRDADNGTGASVGDGAQSDAERSASAVYAMQGLLRGGLDRLPPPGSGNTLDRWRALARVAEHDLSLVKLYEGHTDALAILAEIDPDGPGPGQGLWAVWAAESPAGRTVIQHADGNRVVLSGAKCWCSGADRVDHALLTAWTPEGEGPYLVRVAINDAAGVTVRHGAWQARGMAGSASPDLRFDRVSATRVGRLGDYVARPGFAHGGAGLAACWYGGAVAVATFLHHVVAADKTGGAGPLRQAALGRVARELRACAALLRETAEAIDRDPAADASALALRARLTADDCARTVLDEVSRALGAAPFCRDARFARFAVDLPIFIRQCHGDRDFQALGQTEAGIERPWAL